MKNAFLFAFLFCPFATSAFAGRLQILDRVEFRGVPYAEVAEVYIRVASINEKRQKELSPEYVARFNAACALGCIDIRTLADSRCYISLEELAKANIDPELLKKDLLDPNSESLVACDVDTGGNKRMIGLANQFLVSGLSE